MTLTTTVQVTEDVIEMLKQLRKQAHANSYNEVIRQALIKTHHRKSFGGILGHKLSMNEILKDLRDKENYSGGSK